MYGISVSKSGKIAAFAGIAASLVFAGGALGDDKTFRGLRKGDYDNKPQAASNFRGNDRGNDRGGDRGGDRGHDRGRSDNNWGRHDDSRSRVNLNVNLGWAGSYYNRNDRCDDRVVVVNRGYGHSDWRRDRCDEPRRVVVVDRPCPPPVIVREPCPQPTVIVRDSCPPPVIVREPCPQPTVVVQTTSYSVNDYASLRDRAAEQFRAGRLTIAADLYREYLRNQAQDDYARRALAYCLLTDNKFEDAIGLMSTAYSQSPVLARSTIALGSLPDGGSCLGARFQEVRSIAERSNNWQAYLTAAVIAQSIGNYDLAASMIDSARRTGMNEQTGVEMSLAVTNVIR